MTNARDKPKRLRNGGSAVASPPPPRPSIKTRSTRSRGPVVEEEPELPPARPPKTATKQAKLPKVDKQQQEKAAMAVKRKRKKIGRLGRAFKCDACGKVFQGRNDLRKHSLIHAGLKPHACEHCDKRFRQAGNLRNHVTSHHSNMMENPVVFVCDYCGKTFLIKERLRLHIRVHTGTKPYPCRFCPMRFARLGQMKQHTRVHTGERNFRCGHCDATFTCGNKLKLHTKSHYDIREYTCDLCGKSFLRPDGMQKHLKCFHNNEKPFKCTICNKLLKGHLQEHMRTHESARPHGCSECGARFAQRSQLVVHQRTHSGARPYRCRVCWRAFGYSTALKLHVRRHTGEKPFACPLCPATFFQLPHMKKHVNGVHNEKRTYRHRACGALFRMKSELDAHAAQCAVEPGADGGGGGAPEAPDIEEELSQRVADAYKAVEPPMALTKMRLLVAVLLKKISSSKRLEELGFNKRLIDDILAESLELSGHKPCKDDALSAAERLRYNVQLLLDWTVPPRFMEQFREERRSTEELLEELTS